MSSEAYMALREELRALGIDDKLEAIILKKIEVAYNEGYAAGWNEGGYPELYASRKKRRPQNEPR